MTGRFSSNFKFLHFVHFSSDWNWISLFAQFSDSCLWEQLFEYLRESFDFIINQTFHFNLYLIHRIVEFLYSAACNICNVRNREVLGFCSLFLPLGKKLIEISWAVSFFNDSRNPRNKYRKNNESIQGNIMKREVLSLNLMLFVG